MPVVVDHDQRRIEIAELVAEMIATEGLDAVTVRAVAEEAGCSTAVVSHYFNGKRALLLHCYQMTATHSTLALVEAEALHPGNLAAILDVLLPYHKLARRNWLVWVAFWGVAIADAEFFAVQQQQIKDATKRVAALFRARQESPAPFGKAVWEDIAAALLTVLMGISVQAAFDPAAWPAKRQQQHLAHAISASLARAGMQC